jgi:hypothetical protein
MMAVMDLCTAFTEFFAVQHPIALAPMGGSAGGALAAAVSNGGGLGLLGGGNGWDRDWLERELSILAHGTDKPWGVGFQSWAVDVDTVELALRRNPRAVMLSFGEGHRAELSRRRSRGLMQDREQPCRRRAAIDPFVVRRSDHDEVACVELHRLLVQHAVELARKEVVEVDGTGEVLAHALVSVPVLFTRRRERAHDPLDAAGGREERVMRVRLHRRDPSRDVVEPPVPHADDVPTDDVPIRELC